MLNKDDYQRYARHLSLAEIGIAGQERLQRASVLCVGLGGLGSPAALYLAAAGVGRIGLVDPDIVTLSNLQRQIIHNNNRLGEKKVSSAAQTLRELNPNLQLDLYDVTLSSSNAEAIAAPYELILDGSDNFSTRYLCNDLGFFLKKPVIYGSIYRFHGECSLFDPYRGGGCYRCLFPEPPPQDAIPNCSQAGVLGVLPGIIGTLQATEALRYLLQIGTPESSLRGKLLHYDALELSFKKWQLRADPDCPLCGNHPKIRKLIEEQCECAYNTSMSTDSSPSIPTITIEALCDLLKDPEELLLIDVREPFEYEIVHIPHAELMPLQDLLAGKWTLPTKTATYLYCKSGGRSAFAIEELQKKGFHNLYNVEGGIKAWVEKVNPSLPTYW